MMVVKLSFFFLKKMVNKNKNRSAMLLLILSGVWQNKSRNRNALYMELEIHGELKT